MEIYYTALFERQFKKLPRVLQQRALAKEKMFRLNPFNPSLRVHKLTGKLNGIWSFSVDYQHRILFRFITDEEAMFEAIGDHSIYQRSS